MKPENTNLPKQPEFGATMSLPNLEQLPPLATGMNGAKGPEAGVEAGVTTGAERHEQVAELSAMQADATATVTVVPTAVPVAPVAPVALNTTPLLATSSPLTAGHDDVMEKEWVDRAKHIVSVTKDDPNQRKQQVDLLQKDYLHKRYGKELGAA